MAWVSLVRVDTTVGTVCAAAGFLAKQCTSVNLETAEAGMITYRSLLHNDALDEKVLELQVLRIRIRLGVLQEAGDELHGLLGPATCEFRITFQLYVACMM